MRSCTLHVLCVAVASFSCHPAIAQDEAAKRVAELEAKIDPLYAAAKFAEVYPLLEEQLRLHVAAGGRESEPAIAMLVRLGDCLGKQQKFLEAAKPFGEALALDQKRLGNEHAETLRLHSLTGGMLACGGRYAEAEQHFQAALDGRRKLFGEEHALVAAGFRELAWAVNSQGRHKEAEPLARAALALHERHSAADRDTLAQILNLYAFTLFHQRRFAEAEPLFERNLAICRELFDGEHCRTLTAIRTLADARRLAGEHAAALALLEEFNPLAERILGRANPERIEGLVLTAFCHQALQRPAEEERALRAIFAGDAAPATAQRSDHAGLRRRLLAALAAQQKFAAAVDQLSAWWPADKPSGGPLDQELLGAVQLLAAEALLAHWQGHRDEAIACTRQLVAIVSPPEGKQPAADQHFVLGYCHFVLGTAHHHRRDLAEARQQLEAALACFTAALPPDRFPAGHRNLAQVQYELADVMHAMGEYGKSGEHCRQALEMNRKLYPAEQFPDGHPALAASLMQMAFMQGGGPNSIPLYQEALAIQRRLYPPAKFGSGHPELINTLNQLGNALAGQHRVEEGLKHLEEAVSLQRARGEEAGASWAISLQYLGRVQAMTGRLAEAERSYAEAAANYRREYPSELFPLGHDSIV